MVEIPQSVKKEISRIRSEVRKLQETRKDISPFTGAVTGNYWTQTGMPWVNAEGRKAVLTEFFWQPIRGQPRRVDTNELRQFSQTFWVNSCVKVLMDEISSCEWDIMPKEGVEYDWVKEDIIKTKEFLKYPNKNRESFAEIARSLIKDILEIDAGVLVKVFDMQSYDFEQLEPKSGAPLLKPLGQRNLVEIYARDGASFLKEIDKFGFVRGTWQYSYQIPAHPMWFNKAEIVYVSEQNRSMSCYGFARTQSILDIVKSLHYSTLYNKRYFEENPIPDGALALLDTNETEMKSFMSWWNQEFKAQPHKLAVINKDIKWQPFNVSNKELEFLETQKWYYKMVISAFGLTPNELGMTDDSNRSTSATQAEVMKRKGIRPFLKIIENAINEGILPEFNVEGIEFQFIYDDPAEKAARLSNWQVELNMGVKTINEVRNELGLEPLTNGDTNSAIQSMNQSQMMFNQGSTESSEEPDGESNGYSDTLSREEGKASKGFKDKKKKQKDESTEEDGEEETNEDTKPEDVDKKEEKVDTQVEGDEGVVNPENSKLVIEADKEQQKRRMEAEEEAKGKIQNPFSQATRPVGSFKGMKDYKRMTYEDLISEHKKLVSIMESGDMDKIKAEAKDQKKELDQYKEEAEKSESPEKKILSDIKQEIYRDLSDEIYKILVASGMSTSEAARYAQKFKMRMRTKKEIEPNSMDLEKPEVKKKNKHSCNIHKGIDNGQYYHEGLEYGNRSGIPASMMDVFPSQLVADHRNPAKHRYRSNEIRCPICGAPTLAVITSADDLNQTQQMKCVSCGAQIGMEEVLEYNGLIAMNETLTANNSTEAINKALGDDSIKEWVGWDFEKTLYHLDSKPTIPYLRKLRRYLDDIPHVTVDKIANIIWDGLRENQSMGQIQDRINKLIKDPIRSEKITRTEIVRITDENNQARMEERGATKFKWISAPEDGRLCEECSKLDNKIFDIDSKTRPPLHVNCRCNRLEWFG